MNEQRLVEKHRERRSKYIQKSLQASLANHGRTLVNADAAKEVSEQSQSMYHIDEKLDQSQEAGKYKAEKKRRHDRRRAERHRRHRARRMKNMQEKAREPMQVR